MPATAYKTEPLSAGQILAAAHDDICALAEEAGIDGHALLARPIPPGCLLRGRDVPVINSGYRGKCSVLLYIHERAGGGSWPFIRFFTFRHGGVETTFNGLRWLREASWRLGRPVLKRRAVRIDTGAAERRLEQEAQRRQQRHDWLTRCYACAAPISPQHPWMLRRLAGYGDDALLARCDLRVSGPCLLVPIEHPELGVVGYHRIRPQSEGDEKRHFVRQSGLLKGAAVRIRASRPGLPVMLCEGLATALALALVWPGEIRACLSCHNLDPARAQVSGRVVICHDNDPDANPGLAAAAKAARPGDRLIGPHFADGACDRARSDFNDLLMEEGFAALWAQIRGAAA